MGAETSNGWKKVYPFEELEIGESLEVTGIEGNIRSAASMWGTRYGIWLQVTKIDDGVMKVTRFSAPSPTNRKRKKTLKETLEIMTELLLEIKELVKEKE